jgi:hypothetical protein
MSDVVIYDEVADNNKHCAYCGARLDIGPPNHICKEVIYGTVVTPTTPFLPFDLPAPKPEPPPAAFRPKKIWAEELLNAVEHGRSL